MLPWQIWQCVDFRQFSCTFILIHYICIICIRTVGDGMSTLHSLNLPRGVAKDWNRIWRMLLETSCKQFQLWMLMPPRVQISSRAVDHDWWLKCVFSTVCCTVTCCAHSSIFVAFLYSGQAQRTRTWKLSSLSQRMWWTDSQVSLRCVTRVTKGNLT